MGLVESIMLVAFCVVLFFMFRLQVSEDRYRSIDDLLSKIEIESMSFSFRMALSDLVGEYEDISISPFKMKFRKPEHKKRVNFLKATKAVVDNSWGGEATFEALGRLFKTKNKEDFDIELWTEFFEILSSEEDYEPVLRDFIKELKHSKYNLPIRALPHSRLEKHLVYADMELWAQSVVEDPSILELPIDWQVSMCATTEVPETNTDDDILLIKDGSINQSLKTRDTVYTADGV